MNGLTGKITEIVSKIEVKTNVWEVTYKYNCWGSIEEGMYRGLEEDVDRFYVGKEITV